MNDTIYEKYQISHRYRLQETLNVFLSQNVVFSHRTTSATITTSTIWEWYNIDLESLLYQKCATTMTSDNTRVVCNNGI